MLESNVRHALSRMLKAYIHMTPPAGLLVLDAFQGLRRCDSFVEAVRQGTSISMQKFTDDLRHSLRTVWRDVEGFNPQDKNSKLATYQPFFAMPFYLNVRSPLRLPRHLHLNLSQHVLRNVGLRAHTSAETAL